MEFYKKHNKFAGRFVNIDGKTIRDNDILAGDYAYYHGIGVLVPVSTEEAALRGCVEAKELLAAKPEAKSVAPEVKKVEPKPIEKKVEEKIEEKAEVKVEEPAPVKVEKKEKVAEQAPKKKRTMRKRQPKKGE